MAAVWWGVGRVTYPDDVAVRRELRAVAWRRGVERRRNLRGVVVSWRRDLRSGATWRCDLRAVVV